MSEASTLSSSSLPPVRSARQLADEASAELLSQQMRSYWTHFAATGLPAQGQDGSLPRWAPFGLAPDAPKSMILDTAAGGGLRMSPEAWTLETVLERVRLDEELATTGERCEVYQTFAQWSDAISPEEYEELESGGCAAHPLPGRTAFD